MPSVARRFAPELLALAAGLIVWLVIGTMTHNREAWDTPAYLWLGVPTLALSTATLAFFFPAHPYRIGVLPMGAQAVWAYATEPWGPFGHLLVPFGCALAGWAVGHWKGNSATTLLLGVVERVRGQQK